MLIDVAKYKNFAQKNASGEPVSSLDPKNSALGI
jgi:hypothetical protein